MTIAPIRRPSISFATPILVCVVFVSLARANEPTEPIVAIEDFCSDPRIVLEMQRKDPKLQPMGQPSCESSKVAFRRDGELTDIPVAHVFRGFVQSYDMIWGVSDSIIRLPDNRLVNLGPNAPVPFREFLESHLVRVLGMQRSAAIPQYYQFDSFYSAVLESTESGYCMFYEMKQPFAGQLSHCSRMDEFSGEVSCVHGATTWQEAKEIACGFSESGCSVYGMSLVTNAQGRAITWFCFGSVIAANSSTSMR